MKRFCLTVAITVLATALLSGCGGRYRIKSDPPGAAVTVNGLAYGNTPTDVPISQLPSEGFVEVVLDKPGHGSIRTYVPGPTSGIIGSEITVKIPKQESDSDKVNRYAGLLIKANELVFMKRYPDALRLVEDAIKENPKYVHAQSLKASILFLTKNVEEAIVQWKHVLEIEPANVEAVRMLEVVQGQGRGVAGGAP